MTASFAYRRRRQFRSLAPSLAPMMVLLGAVLGASTSAHGAETLTVVLDQATISKLPERVATIVIGNPMIADITVQTGGLIVVTGKAFGTTNMIALDRAGAVLAERNIEVLGPNEKVVVVYRGLGRESYSCTPECQPRITLGDAPDFFGQVMGESAAHSARAKAP
jgi:Flp pilus assembly secretin CpaC